MRIGLIAVDGHNGFPNLALMRLSTWHKQQGDAVEWWNGFTHYDRVYKSKVFTYGDQCRRNRDGRYRLQGFRRPAAGGRGMSSGLRAVSKLETGNWLSEPWVL